MINNSRKPNFINKIPELVSKEFSSAFRHGNVVKGFEKSGICPFNDKIFTDNDFMGSSVIDVPNPQDLSRRLEISDHDQVG